MAPAAAQAAIYIDGPPHRYPERQERDRQQTACMEDLGYTVIRFATADDWSTIVQAHPNNFGSKQRESGARE